MAKNYGGFFFLQSFDRVQTPFYFSQRLTELLNILSSLHKIPVADVGAADNQLGHALSKQPLPPKKLNCLTCKCVKNLNTIHNYLVKWVPKICNEKGLQAAKNQGVANS